jgi:hypothetical protein
MSPTRVRTYEIPAGTAVHRCRDCGDQLYQIKVGEGVLDLDPGKAPTAEKHGYGKKHECLGRHE